MYFDIRSAKNIIRWLCYLFWTANLVFSLGIIHYENFFLNLAIYFYPVWLFVMLGTILVVDTMFRDEIIYPSFDNK